MKNQSSEPGSAVGKEMDAPASLVDHMMREAAGQKLKDSWPRSKPNLKLVPRQETET